MEENILKLSRTYTFEGEKISELDFSGADDVTARDMMEAADQLTRAGRVVINPENDVQYCLWIAAAITHKPHEFFDKLKARDIVRVKNKVRMVFYGGE
jgi:alkyl hydroperoxide reductase subunit AhpC